MAKRKAKNISEQLQQAIRESEMSHYRLWKVSDVSISIIDRFMSGERSLRLDTAGRLCNALGLELKR